jgi:hypothetical protein
LGGEEIITLDDDDAYLLRSQHWCLQSNGNGKFVYRFKNAASGTANGATKKYSHRGQQGADREHLSHVIMGIAGQAGMYVEHINGDWRDFRRCNLSVKTRADAMRDKAPTARAIQSIYKACGL